MKPQLSLCLAYHQEGLPFIMEAINQIRETIDVDDYEIIVTDDGSREPLQPIDGVKIIRHKTNLGVGRALRTAIDAAKSDNIWMMGSDIRFIKNQWASKMIEQIKLHPKAITCTVCVGLNQTSPESMDITKRINRSRRLGANILMFEDKRSHPKRDETFRDILSAQWRPVPRDWPTESFPIACVLGAAYGCSKKWVQHIRLWEAHKSWGGLEPQLSLSSWLMGGECRVDPTIYTGHIFKSSGTHGTPFSHVTYNKIATAMLLFDDYHSQRLINFLGDNPQVAAAKKLVEKDKKHILKLRKDIQPKITYDVVEYCKRFNLDFRLD